MNKYKVVMGVEIHLELLTKTKMFSSAPVVYGVKPNIAVDETVLGYPGAMPQVNKRAVELGIMAAHLLGMQIDNVLKFDRKHYWYHDLPKGFQITQNNNPIGSKGKLTISGKEINITRAHLEEDTAKTIKKEGKLFIDYNRCGNPLLEIVTGPDFSTKEEVIEYVNTIKQLMFYSGISNSKMEEGSLRCDVNISLHRAGAPLGQRVEIKNLNSTSNIGKAIEFEIARHQEKLDNKEELTQETRRFDEKTQETVSMRSKENSTDYKYIRETNIQDIHLDKEFVFNSISKIPFNIIEFKKNLQLEGFDKKEINEILNQFHLKDYIIAFATYNKNTNKYFNIMLNNLSPLLLKHDVNYLTPMKFIKVVDKIAKDKTANSVYKKVLKQLVLEDVAVVTAFNNNKIDFIEDKTTLKNIAESIISDKMKEEYVNRPERIEKQIMGQVMKLTQGKANPIIAMEIIKELLGL